MRVLHTVPGRNWGGLEQRAIRQVAWLIDNGHESWLASPADGESYQRAQAQGLPVIDFNFDVPFSPATLIAMRRLVRRLRPDVADAHATRDVKAFFGSIDLLALVKSRHVSHRLKPGLGRVLQWRYIPDHVVVTAEIINKHLTEIGLVDPRRCSVIGEWAEDDFFAPSTKNVRQELGIDDRSFVIGCVGMLRYDKGQDLLVDAFPHVLKRLPNARLMIVGEGTAENAEFQKSLRDKAAAPGCQDKVIMTGYRTDVADVIDSCDLMVVPSRIDAQTRVVPQAFARGKPVLARRIGALPEMIEDGVTGRLVDAEDPEGIAAAVLELAENADLARRLGRNGYDFAHNHLGFEVKMIETLAVYEKALERARTRPLFRVRTAR